jgi:hypothetical protein
MKKLTIAFTVCCAMLFANMSSNAAVTTDGTTVTVNPTDEWMKSRNGAWAGDMNGQSYWYKLDKKTGKIWWSTNKGKDWAHVESQMWSDKSGKWMKISDKNVVWSTDMGKTWSTVPDWTWQGSDGKWYKIDKDWNVWEKEK